MPITAEPGDVSCFLPVGRPTSGHTNQGVHLPVGTPTSVYAYQWYTYQWVSLSVDTPTSRYAYQWHAQKLLRPPVA